MVLAERWHYTIIFEIILIMDVSKLNILPLTFWFIKFWIVISVKSNVTINRPKHILHVNRRKYRYLIKLVLPINIFFYQQRCWLPLAFKFSISSQIVFCAEVTHSCLMYVLVNMYTIQINKLAFVINNKTFWHMFKQMCLLLNGIQANMQSHFTNLQSI